MVIQRITALLVIFSTFVWASAPEDRVSPSGFAGVEIGMSVSGASTASGMGLLPLREVAEDELGCYYVTPGGTPDSIFFMIWKGQVVRIDIDGPGILTVEGVGIGSTESEVLAAYPDQVITTSHPYTGPEGHYLTVEFENSLTIIFEADGKKVISYRAGRDPAIRWIEGCS